jgi:hypothetical protein
MIHLTRSGTVNTYSQAEIEHLRREFHENHCITLPQLLPSQVVEMLRHQIEHADFETRIHPDVKPPPVDLCMKANASSELLNFLVNDAVFYGLIKELTHAADIRCFAGNVYRFDPTLGTFDVWHSDAVKHRILAMSINLSGGIYSGGILQIRERQSQRIVYEVANIGIGDAILFAIAPTLQHRVSPIEGTVARTAFAGWFYSATSDGPLSRQSASASTGDIPSERGSESSPTEASRIVPVASLIPRLHSEIRVAHEIFSRVHEDTFVLYDARVGSYYALNPVGHRIWDLLCEDHTLRAVVELLADEYDASPEHLQQDVLSLVGDLGAAGLVEIG